MIVEEMDHFIRIYMMPDNPFRDLVASNVYNDDSENNNDPYKAFCAHEISYLISKRYQSFF